MVLTAPFARPASGQSGDDDTRVRHVVSRLSYGPRPGDIARVRAIGIEAYIEEQLHPERLNDARADAKLSPFPMRGMGSDGLRALDMPDAPIAVRHRTTALEKGMDPALTRAGLTDRARLRLGFLNPEVGGRSVRTGPEPVMEREPELRLLRGVYSERQLYELMVDFWMNHFNIRFGDPFPLFDFEENVVRPRALGNFHDLLVATAQHPAMLIYLDNWLSSAPEDEVRGRLLGSGEGLVRGALSIRARAGLLDKATGLNENYGRELMELHTVGADGGYTQEDVIQVARALTGWTISGWLEDVPDGDFVFEPALHIPGDKVVMGRRIPSGGVEEGLAILDMLAHHPSTAHYISTKLVRRFVADEPPAEIVAAAARTFQETRGDIRAVLATIFAHPGFFAAEVRGAKIKKPLEMVVSALRAVNADIDTRFGEARVLATVLARMGEPLYQHEAPDGYPDVAAAWMSTNAMFQRLRFGLDLARGQVPGVAPDLDAAEALFHELGLAVTEEQVATARRLISDGALLAAAASGMMAGEAMMAAGAGAGDPAMSPDMYKGDAAMMRVLDVSETEAGGTGRSALAVALLLGSPAFQKR
jgi:uncharacterized protein (DUF1800 family)